MKCCSLKSSRSIEFSLRLMKCITEAIFLHSNLHRRCPISTEYFFIGKQPGRLGWCAGCRPPQLQGKHSLHLGGMVGASPFLFDLGASKSQRDTPSVFAQSLRSSSRKNTCTATFSRSTCVANHCGLQSHKWRVIKRVASRKLGLCRVPGVRGLMLGFAAFRCFHASSLSLRRHWLGSFSKSHYDWLRVSFANN